nr:MAG TPA: hypothetical protein [Caudoviricetes sp.]
MMNTNIIFTVKKRHITSDTKSIDLIGDNMDYTAVFDLDEDLASERIKTARFIKDDEQQERILNDNNSCQIPPELLKKGFISVGVYTDEKSTTPCFLQINRSIRETDYPMKDPEPDVYRQLLDKIEKLKGVRETEIRNNGEEIQWRYVGEEEWEKLISVSDITGYTPVKGKDYFDGKDGIVIPSNGMFTMEIVGNDLMIYYNDSDKPPSLRIDENGHLIFGEG